MRRITLFYLFTTLILAIAPQALFAADFSFSYTNPDDRSLNYLGIIFGNMGPHFQSAPSNNMIQLLFSVFNIAVLTIGAIVVSYTIILSTINTAQEGEVMGRKWSSLWIPLRSAMGMAFLLPTTGGYSVLQVMMMTVVVYGVNAADQLWDTVIQTMNEPGGLGGKSVNSDSAVTTAMTLYNGLLCVETFNQNTACSINVAGQTLTDYRTTSGVMFGVPNDPTNNRYRICGAVFSNPAKPANVSASDWQLANKAAIDAALNILRPAAQEAMSGSSTPSDPDFMKKAVSAIKNGIASVPTQAAQLDAAKQQVTKDGWIFAGSYYMTLTHTNTSATFPAPLAIGMNTSGLGSACVVLYAGTQVKSATYLAGSSSSTTSRDSLSIPSVTADSNTAQFVDAIAAPLREAVEDFNETLTTNDIDPVASVANVGATILATTEDIWFGVMAAGIFLMLGGCIMSGMQPLCWVLGAIITLVVPILNIIIALLWGVGAMLGIYMPMIPYIVFTFTALGWLLLVVETIVAAPIVALGLVSPAEGHLGKAAPAVILITNVFLRPSLMIIGLVVAITLVKAVIAMLNFGFAATINATVSGLGVFGLIALLCLYGGTALALIHECFNIIHILPDKVIRWIGGQAEKTGEKVKEQLETAKGKVEEGAQMGAKIMQTSSAEMEKVGKEHKAKGTGIGGFDSSIKGLGL